MSVEARTWRPQWACLKASAVIALVVVGARVAVIAPVISDTARAVHDLDAQLARLEPLAADESRLDLDLANRARQLERLRAALPPERGDVEEALRNALAKSGLRNVDVILRATRELEAPGARVTELDFQVRASPGAWPWPQALRALLRPPLVVVPTQLELEDPLNPASDLVLDVTVPCCASKR
jgi:hypothetical protein